MAAPAERHRSFRDPAGRLVPAGERILRAVLPAGEPDLVALLDAPRARARLAAGDLVATRVLDDEEHEATIGGLTAPDDTALLLEHERVPFASFPHEWPPEMLHAAARLTLDLAEDLLADGLGLKDATPYNVLFRGPRPVFVDVLSFERRDPADPTWLPYAQFARTFLLPLLAWRRLGRPSHEPFLARRDGLTPESLYHALGWPDRLAPSVLPLVSIPRWLGARPDGPDRPGAGPRRVDPARARFTLEGVLKHLRRRLDAVRPPERRSAWSGYRGERHGDAYFAAREAAVARVLAERRPAAVLDVGANTGGFSALAARSGARVVAIDSDPVVVGETWRRATAEGLDVLPLVVDLARPTPALGWRNGESPSFLDRAAGAFDGALLLAVVHHLLVTERVPLEEIVDLVAELVTDFAVVEFVAPEDPMFRAIARGREPLFADLDADVFRAAWARRFRVVSDEPLPVPTRRLLVLER